MNILLQVQQHLMRTLNTDPQQQLALLVSLLDPLWQHDWDDPDPEADEDDLRRALIITRKAFPDLYTEAILALQQGITENDLDQLLCTGFTRRGIPLEDTQWLGYGIPLTAAGVNLGDADLYPDAEFTPILEWFGIEVDDYTLDIPQTAYAVGDHLAESLRQQPDLEWQNVGWLIAWLFSCTGNTLADATHEDLYGGGYELLTWEPDDIQFAIEMNQICETILTDANLGWQWLLANPAACHKLQENIHHTYRWVGADHQPPKKKGKPYEPHVRLDWTIAPDRAE